jgi:hypothetical protein
MNVQAVCQALVLWFVLSGLWHGVAIAMDGHKEVKPMGVGAAIGVALYSVAKACVFYGAGAFTIFF